MSANVEVPVSGWRGSGGVGPDLGNLLPGLWIVQTCHSASQKGQAISTTSARWHRLCGNGDKHESPSWTRHGGHTCIPTIVEERQENCKFKDSLDKGSETLSQMLSTNKRAREVVQVVERLPTKLKALSSNPSTTKKKKTKIPTDAGPLVQQNPVLTVSILGQLLLLPDSNLQPPSVTRPDTNTIY
jgi:hypothetical protein